MLRYFHYRKLSKESQNAYKAIVEAIKGFKENAVISSVVNLQVVINAVKNDNPHFFFVDWYSILYNSSFSGTFNKTILSFKYTMDRTKALEYYERAKQIAQSLKKGNELKTIKNVHDHLAKTIVYDMREMNSDFFRINNHNIIGALFEDMAVCEGISRANQFILKELGIECTYCAGYINDKKAKAQGYHAWNLVKVNNKILKVDVTWDLVDVDDDEISYEFFLVPYRMDYPIE